MHPRFSPAPAALLLLCVCSSARADPWPPLEENVIDDQVVDGDIDEEDRELMYLGGHASAVHGHAGSWVSLVAFAKELVSGRSDVGGMVVVGLALDRLAAGPAHPQSEQARTDPPPAPIPPPTPPAAPGHRVLVAPSLARACVAAALRASGLGVDDSLIEGLIARARESAWLPEARMRAMHLDVDATRTTTLATTDGTSSYETLGAHLVLEIRLTWRLDRLLYAGDEPGLERVRLERQAARSRLTERTLELLFAWQRAVVEEEGLPPGSNEEIEQELRASEMRANLDVLTGGWFSRRGD